MFHLLDAGNVAVMYYIGVADMYHKFDYRYVTYL